MAGAASGQCRAADGAEAAAVVARREWPIRPDWEPTAAQVVEAQRTVAEGLPVHARWWPHLPLPLRERAVELAGRRAA